MGKSYITWPNTNQRKILKSKIERKYKFPSCIGFIDGSLIPLAFQPVWSHQEFHTRKESYAVSCMIVCDHNKRIRMLHSGYAGSAHDMRVLNGSELTTKTKDFFQNGEYLLADSAYAASLTIVPVIKKPYRRSLPKTDRNFNYAHAKARVQVEHCIGILKSRFQSLKGLRLPIRNKEDVARSNAWIRTCCILHNFLIDTDDEADKDWCLEEEEKIKNKKEKSRKKGECSTEKDKFKINDRLPIQLARTGAEKRAILKRIVLSK